MMELELISYQDLLSGNSASYQKISTALLHQGIVGVSDVPEFENITRAYIAAARKFSALDSSIKQQYAPNRDADETEGYELGAEWFKDQAGVWQIDDKKASYYAFVPEHPKNKWPREVDLQTPYLALGKLIFQTGKLLLKIIGLDETVGLNHSGLIGYGRLLHYHKTGMSTNANPLWCGAHFDHGVFTGLAPAYYFQDGKEIDEPEEAGLYIMPSNGDDFKKINARDKSVLLFQVGEFAQLISNDRVRSTQHRVQKAHDGIERYTFALFYSAEENMVINSSSQLISDARYADNKLANGSISYKQWETASFERYRAK